MKCTILLFAFVLPADLATGQNLVPNPSFEEKTGCPEGFPNLDGICHDWTTFRITPDYFHNCSEWCGYNSSRGFQLPHSGLAYAGFNTYQPTLPNQGNEHIGIALEIPLQVGMEYFVSFFVACGYTPLSFNIATNKIGALFTVNSYADPTGIRPMPNDCQVYTNEIVSDTIAWTKISGSFVADSAYQYMVIGNFFEDSFLDTLVHPFSVVPQSAFYFLDDVCVSTDSLYANTWTGVKEQINDGAHGMVYPNPSSGRFEISSPWKIAEIKLFDINGRLLLSTTVNDSKAELNISSERAGMYAARLLFSNGNREFVKILKE